MLFTHLLLTNPKLNSSIGLGGDSCSRAAGDYPKVRCPWALFQCKETKPCLGHSSAYMLVWRTKSGRNVWTFSFMACFPLLI